jgi:hypothetical protein
MKAMTILLLAASFVGPPVDPEDPSRLRSLKATWNEMHAKLSAEKPTINAFIVLDPREDAIWIEKDGKVDPEHVRSLPRDMEWSAFYVGEEGAAEIKFPVRVRRFYSSKQHPRPEELIFVKAFSKGRTWGWQISVGPNHINDMAWGTGNGGKEGMTVARPALKPGKKPSLPENSILQQTTPTPPHFDDQLFSPFMDLKVTRTGGAK